MDNNKSKQLQFSFTALPHWRIIHRLYNLDTWQEMTGFPLHLELIAHSNFLKELKRVPGVFWANRDPLSAYSSSSSEALTSVKYI